MVSVSLNDGDTELHSVTKTDRTRGVGLEQSSSETSATPSSSSDDEPPLSHKNDLKPATEVILDTSSDDEIKL